LALQVAGASAIVRARVREVTGKYLACDVTKVLFGRIEADAILVDPQGVPAGALARPNLRQRLHREPTAAEIDAEVAGALNIQFGHDAILFLDECRKTEKGTVCRLSEAALACGAPAAFSLDDYEKSIIEVIRTGTALKVQAANLDECVRRAEKVVRAELIHIGDTSAEWKIVSVLYVGPQGRASFRDPAIKSVPSKVPNLPATIRIDLDTWRLRAESLARYRAPGASPLQAPTQQAHELLAGLLREDLAVGQQALLFIKSGPNTKETGVYKPVGILAAEPGKPQDLKETEMKIRRMNQDVEDGIPRH
jgi:hypothetical protein